MIEETSINERILQVIKLKNMSSSQFADITHINRATISQLSANRNSPSFATIMSILETFPEIDANWLLLGRKTLVQSVDKQDDVQLQKTHQLDIFDSQINDSQNIVQPVVQPSKNEIISQDIKIEGKKIEKIVVFYTDRSFSEYKPE